MTKSKFIRKIQKKIDLNSNFMPLRMKLFSKLRRNKGQRMMKRSGQADFKLLSLVIEYMSSQTHLITKITKIALALNKVAKIGGASCVICISFFWKLSFSISFYLQILKFLKLGKCCICKICYCIILKEPEQRKRLTLS